MKRILLAIFLVVVALMSVGSASAVAPTGADNTVTTLEDNDYVFAEADFGFSDSDLDTLAFVKVTTLETVGDLKVSGVDVILNQQIAVADITAGNFKFTPVPDANGAGYDSFGFTVIDSNSEESSAAYTMTIDVTNDDADKPILVSSIPDPTGLVEDALQSGIIQLSTYFICDSGTCSYSVTGDPDGLLDVNPTTGQVDFDPSANWYGTDSVTFVATDTVNSLTGEDDVDIIVANDNADKPTFSGTIPTQTLTEDVAQAGIIQLSTYFSCLGTCGNYAVTGDTNAFLSVDSTTGVVNFVAPSDVYGSETVTFTVEDTVESTVENSNSVIIDVVSDGDDPVFSGTIPTQTLTEDVAQAGIIQLSTYFSCLGTCGNYAVTGDTNNLLDVNALTGQVDFDPPLANWYGSEAVTFTVEDTVEGTTGQSNEVDIMVSAVNDASWKTGVGGLPSSIQIDEDVVPSYTLDLSTYVNKPTSITSVVYDIDTTGLDASKISASLTGSKVTFTTKLNQNEAAGSIVFTVDDGANKPSKSNTIAVTITPVSDAPTFSVSDYVVQEGNPVVITFSELPNVDVDGDSITYSLAYDTTDGTKPEDSTFDILSYWDPLQRTISGWTPAKKDTGELKLKLIGSDGVLETKVPFTLDIYPRYMCEKEEQTTYDLSVDIDNPGDDDEFGPGDTINIEATVSHDAGEDKDVIVKAVLYDDETHKKVADVESDDENVDEDGLPFELEIELPMDRDEDWKGTYVLYVKAYEDGEEETQCAIDSIDLDIGREKNRVIVNDVIINPLSVDAGDNVDITIDILSIGKKEQETVYVKVMNSDLDLDLVSDKISLDEYDGAEVAHIFKFKNVEIPKSADSGNHALNIVVYYDGNSEKYSDSPTYEAINGENVLTVRGTVLAGVVEIAEIEPATKGVYSIPITVTNTGDAGRFTLSLEGVEEFAEEVIPKTFLLSTGGESTKYLEFVLSEDAEAQEYAIDAVLTTVDGQEVVRESFIIDLTEEGLGVAKKSWLSGKAFWIIGDIVLIIVAIFFLKLIFGGKKPEVQEVKL